MISTLVLGGGLCYTFDTHRPVPRAIPCMLWPNRWMHQDATWYEVGLGPGHIVLDGDPAIPKGYSPPIFGTSVVAKRLNGSRCHLVRR